MIFVRERTALVTAADAARDGSLVGRELGRIAEALLDGLAPQDLDIEASIRLTKHLGHAWELVVRAKVVTAE